MVDEVTSHNREVMPLCVRFVDKEKNIREEFIQFSSLTRVTGEAIAAQVCSDLRSLDLDLTNIRGQGYDGASNMSSERVGVQALIRKESPLAVYTHCSGHCLNLVISHSCSTPMVRNILDKMKATCLFFLCSPKRANVLSEIVGRNVVEKSRRAPLIDLCRTRWAERHHAYQHFYQCYKFLVMTLEFIALGLHQNDAGDSFTGASWSADSKRDANSLLHGITAFEFLVVCVTVYHTLSHLSGITVKLQSSTLDIVEAYHQIDEVKQFYKETRKSIDLEFHKMYLQAERMGVAVNVQPSKPRSCVHQRHRPNADADTIEEWYKVNVALPFMDHIIVELETQFSVLTQTSSKLLGLVPSVMCKKDVDVSIAIHNTWMTYPRLNYLTRNFPGGSTSTQQKLIVCDLLLVPRP